MITVVLLPSTAVFILLTQIKWNYNKIPYIQQDLADFISFIGFKMNVLFNRYWLKRHFSFTRQYYWQFIESNIEKFRKVTEAILEMNILITNTPCRIDDYKNHTFPQNGY